MSLENEIRIGGVKAASETGSIRAPAVGGSSAMRSGTAMERGATGPQGPQGPKGDTGATGPAGADGISVTHRWNGTVLEVTSASGTSSADLKGDPGAVAGVKVAGVTHEPDGTGVVDLGDLSGGADLSDAAPADLGTAAAGTSELAARADHVHKMPTAAQVGAATAESVSQLKNDIGEKLGKNDTAADSNKLGGKAPEEYVLDDDALTLEEIEASTDLTGKVASAEAAAKLSKKGTRYKLETTVSSVPCDTWTKCDEGIFLEAGYYLFVCPFFRDQGGGTSIFKTNIALSTSETFSGDAHIGALSTDWLSHSMGAYVFQAKTDSTVNIFVSHTSTVTHTIDIRTDFIRL